MHLTYFRQLNKGEMIHVLYISISIVYESGLYDFLTLKPPCGRSLDKNHIIVILFCLYWKYNPNVCGFCYFGGFCFVLFSL